MGSPFRAAIRAIVFLGWTALLLPLQMLALVFHRRLARRIPVVYHRNACRILGIHVARRGTISTAHPTLFVANHSSYCLLYTSDAADERSSVDLGGRRI